MLEIIAVKQLLWLLHGFQHHQLNNSGYRLAISLKYVLTYVYTFETNTMIKIMNISIPAIRFLMILSNSCLLTLSSVQSLSPVRLFATPWTAARQASLSITNSQSLLKHMSIESVMSSNHLILCHPLLLPPSIFPSIRVFSSESALHIRWPRYWSFSFNISPTNEY